MTFISQNVGAGQKDNLRKVWRVCILTATAAAVVLQTIGILLRVPIVSLFSSDASVIRVGVERMLLILPFFVFCSLLDVTSGAVRGLGRSFQIMLVSLFGTCVLRLVWVFAFLPMHRTLSFLYIAYPLSWVLSFFIATGLFLYLTMPKQADRVIAQSIALSSLE